MLLAIVVALIALATRAAASPPHGAVAGGSDDLSDEDSCPGSEDAVAADQRGAEELDEDEDDGAADRASEGCDLDDAEHDMKLSANADEASGVEAAEVDGAASTSGTLPAGSTLPSGELDDAAGELAVSGGELDDAATLRARAELAFTSAAGFADAAELYDTELRHARPSRWGRVDVSLTWRRHLDEPASGGTVRADELWLLAEWSR